MCSELMWVDPEAGALVGYDEGYVGSTIRTYKTGYYHCGIYLGNGLVAHYSKKKRRKPCIVVEPVMQFSKGDAVDYVALPPNKRFDDQTIVARAMSQVGSRAYSLAFNNCEHFTNWATMGSAFSRQIDVGSFFACALVVLITSAILLPILV